MKKTLIILIVIMFIVSCSKDDESTFLETFDNTVWRFDFTGTNDGPHHLYVRFRNDTDIIIERWIGSQADQNFCSKFIYGDIEIYEIVENSKDIFIFKYESDGLGYITLTFTRNGDKILFESKKSAKDISPYIGTKYTFDALINCFN